MSLATKIILTLTAGAFAVVVMADSRAMECRAEYVGQRQGLAALMAGQVADGLVSLTVSEVMKAKAIPSVIQPLARPFFEADALCQMAEATSKRGTK